jgi:DUF1680 family protein
MPLLDQREVVGHAVRALYLYCGATDVYLETGSRPWLDTLGELWRNLHERRMYVTGGVGSRHEGEAIGDDYELPNRRAYAETCAAVAHAMWAWRMLLATGECRFADALEWTLYNGMLAGIGLDGLSYFYVNPLADRGEHRRQAWFGTACCPPNVARTLASLPGYLYTSSPEGIWVHLYTQSTGRIRLGPAGEVTVVQRTAYPWEGEVAVEIHPGSPLAFTLFVRIPAWCEEAAVTVNGEAVPGTVRPGAYAAVRREWQDGDVVRLSLSMPVRPLQSHPRVLDNTGRVAVTRGPLVYCIEGVDHPGFDVWDVALSPDTRWEASANASCLDGAVVLRTVGTLRASDVDDRSLNRPFAPVSRSATPVTVTAIPYYAWANRAPGPMQTWIPLAP